MTRQEFIDDIMARSTGPVTARTAVPHLSGNMMCVGHIANRDSLGTGPPGKVTIGRRVGYITFSLAGWLADQCQGLTDD